MTFTPCVWCKRAEKSGCAEGMKNEKFTCDFKSLPYEKKAIIERMRSEKAIIDQHRTKVLKRMFTNITEAEDTMRDILDRTYGLQVMATALVEDFGMSEDDLKREVGFVKEQSQKERTMAKIKEMQLRRAQR